MIKVQFFHSKPINGKFKALVRNWLINLYIQLTLVNPLMPLISVDTMRKEEAIQFLQNSWKMNDVESQVKTDRERFLNKLIQTIYERVPFQLLSAFTLASLPPNEREIPSLEQIDKICMSGLGGSCGFLSMFAYRLLKALGYSAHLCGTSVTSTVVNVHLTLIVKDLVNTGDIHLVDCGLGQPSFRAISLNFNEESPVYQESYLEYKYIKRDGKILRMHGEGDLVKRNDPPIEGLDLILGKWRRFYEFSLEDFEQKTLKTLWQYFDMRYAPKNMTPRASRFPGGKAHLIMGNNLFLEQEDRKLKKLNLQSNDEILKAYRDYFPSLDENLVHHAYSIYL